MIMFNLTNFIVNYFVNRGKIIKISEFLCLSDWSGDGFTTAAYASAVLPRREGGLAAAAVYLPAPSPRPQITPVVLRGPSALPAGISAGEVSLCPHPRGGEK